MKMYPQGEKNLEQKLTHLILAHLILTHLILNEIARDDLLVRALERAGVHPSKEKMDYVDVMKDINQVLMDARVSVL